jgi:hypothetical protein
MLLTLQPENRFMIYIKSVLVGVGGAILAAVLWIAVAFLLPIFLPYLIARVRGTGGMSFGQIGSDSILVAALLGFIIGFAWEWHRLRSA